MPKLTEASESQEAPIKIRSPNLGIANYVTMGFVTQMKGSARNVCTFFNVH